jgi:hypothetical protein
MGKRGVLLTVGPLLIVLGGVPLLMIYGVAAMVNPNLDDWDYWSLVLNKMFNFSNAGWVTVMVSIIVAFGCVLSEWGLLVLAGGMARYLTKPRT